MALDLAARAKFAQQQREKALIQAMKSSQSPETKKDDSVANDIAVIKNNIIEALKEKASDKADASEVLSLFIKNDRDKEVLREIKRLQDISTQSSESSQEVSTRLGKLSDAIVLVYKAITRPLVLPKIFQIKGDVEVKKQPPVTVANLNEMKKYFDSLEQSFNRMLLAIQAMPQPQIKLPKIEIPAQIKNDNPELTDLLEKLHEKLDDFSSPQPTSMRRTEELLEGILSRPQLTPQPVTNININGLQGYGKSTSQTVTTTPSTLPGYGQLFNRRSMIIFNNSGNTLYIGGSDVTTSNGLPVLSQSYSPAIDAGYNMVIYGVFAIGSGNVRVFEISKDKENDVQG